MSKKETFVLVSLEEEKAKKLAEVLSNDTARRILDLLAQGESSALDISKKLNVPLPTVLYNLNSLVKSSLVETKEFVWSTKGKEINIYTLARKYIVIAPSGAKGIKNQLKNILPATLVSFGLSAILYAASKMQKTQSISLKTTDMAQEASMALVATPPAVSQNAFNLQQFSIYFFFGSIFAILVYVIVSLIKESKTK